jgi:hypothetical protein
MSIDAEWSEGYVLAIGPFTHLLEVIVEMVNLSPGGALRGKRRIIGYEGRGV